MGETRYIQNFCVCGFPLLKANCTAKTYTLVNHPGIIMFTGVLNINLYKLYDRLESYT